MIIWAKTCQNEALSSKENGSENGEGKVERGGNRVGQPELQGRRRLEKRKFETWQSLFSRISQDSFTKAPAFPFSRDSWKFNCVWATDCATGKISLILWASVFSSAKSKAKPKWSLHSPPALVSWFLWVLMCKEEANFKLINDFHFRKLKLFYIIIPW